MDSSDTGDILNSLAISIKKCNLEGISSDLFKKLTEQSHAIFAKAFSCDNMY